MDKNRRFEPAETLGKCAVCGRIEVAFSSSYVCADCKKEEQAAAIEKKEGTK